MSKLELTVANMMYGESDCCLRAVRLKTLAAEVRALNHAKRIKQLKNLITRARRALHI